MKLQFYFNRSKKLNKLGQGLIQLEIYMSKKERKMISTGILIEPEYWNDKAKSVKEKYPEYAAVNKILNDLVMDIKNHEYKILAERQNFSFKDVKLFFEYRDISERSFLCFYQKEIGLLSGVKVGTIKEHAYTLNVLRNWRPIIQFRELTYTLAQEFDTYMREELRLSQNTIKKHHAHVRQYMTYAKKKGILNIDKLDSNYFDFTLRGEETSVEFLQDWEVVKIEKLEILKTHPEMEIVRDLFLFSCYTGIRFSDVMGMKPEYLKYDSNGNMSVKFVMIKVGRKLELPLFMLFNGKPREILNKYIDKNKDAKSDRFIKYKDEYIFPQMTNQCMNRHLKTMAILAGIKKKLTFHLARHTFGTLLAEKTFNPFLIKDLMGHQKIETSLNYIHRTQIAVNRQLKNVDWKLLNTCN